nr:MAG TPA: hypothetical protein [Bacteriophage sp.]
MSFFHQILLFVNLLLIEQFHLFLIYIFAFLINYIFSFFLVYSAKK